MLGYKLKKISHSESPRDNTTEKGRGIYTENDKEMCEVLQDSFYVVYNHAKQLPVLEEMS